MTSTDTSHSISQEDATVVKVTLMWCWDTTLFGIAGVGFPTPSDDIGLTEFTAEKHPADNGEGYAVRFKFAFQYCGEGDPWWTKCLGFPRESFVPLPLRPTG